MQRPFNFALLLAPMGLWNGNDGKSSLRHEANFVSLFANQYAKRPLFALLLSQIYLACQQKFVIVGCVANAYALS